MVETFCIAAGHRDFGKRAHDDILAECNERWLSFSWASCPSFITAVSASFLALLWATCWNVCPLLMSCPSSGWGGSFMQWGLLSVINKPGSMVFYFSENKQLCICKRKWEYFQWALGCLWFEQATNCYASSHFPSFPSHVDAGHGCSSEQLWQSAVVMDSVDHYPLNPPNSPHGRHHFLPAYRVRNGGKKVKQPAQGHAESWGMCSGEDCVGPGRNPSLFRQLRPCWFQIALCNIFFAWVHWSCNKLIKGITVKINPTISSISQEEK